MAQPKKHLTPTDRAKAALDAARAEGGAKKGYVFPRETLEQLAAIRAKTGETERAVLLRLIADEAGRD